MAGGSYFIFEVVVDEVDGQEKNSVGVGMRLDQEFDCRISM